MGRVIGTQELGQGHTQRRRDRPVFIKHLVWYARRELLTCLIPVIASQGLYHPPFHSYEELTSESKQACSASHSLKMMELGLELRSLLPSRPYCLSIPIKGVYPKYRWRSTWEDGESGTCLTSPFLFTTKKFLPDLQDQVQMSPPPRSLP